MTLNIEFVFFLLFVITGKGGELEGLGKRGGDKKGLGPTLKAQAHVRGATQEKAGSANERIYFQIILFNSCSEPCCAVCKTLFAC